MQHPARPAGPVRPRSWPPTYNCARKSRSACQRSGWLAPDGQRLPTPASWRRSRC